MRGRRDSRCPSGGGLEHRERRGEASACRNSTPFICRCLEKIRLWPVNGPSRCPPTDGITDAPVIIGRKQRVPRLRNCTTKPGSNFLALRRNIWASRLNHVSKLPCSFLGTNKRCGNRVTPATPPGGQQCVLSDTCIEIGAALAHSYPVPSWARCHAAKRSRRIVGFIGLARISK